MFEIIFDVIQIAFDIAVIIYIISNVKGRDKKS